MAALTWRSVDAPDFRTSLEGYKTFSNLLGGAFEGLDRSLVQADDAISQKVNNQLALEAAAAQTPEAARALAANLASRADARRIAPETIAAIQSRPTELLREAGLGVGLDSARLTLDDARYTSARTRDANARIDAARPDATAYAAAVARGDYKAASSILGNSKTISGMDPKDILGLASAGMEAEKNAVGIQQDRLGLTTTVLNQEGKRISNAQGAFDLALGRANEADRRAGQSLVVGVLENAFDGESAREALFKNPAYAGASESAKAVALQAIEGRFPDFNAPSAPVGNPADVILGNGRFGSPPNPISSMKIGDVINFGKNVLIPNTRDNAQLGLSGGKGSSAVGAYQITQDTLNRYAPEVLGKDWKNKTFDLQTQDKLARAIFEDNKNGDLSKIWTSLPAGTTGRGRTWEEMRDQIAQGESGSSTSGLLYTPSAQLANAGNRASVLIDQRTSQTNVRLPADVLRKAQANTETDISKFAENLTKINGFKGSNPLQLEQLIQSTMRLGNVNAATATEMIKNNISTAPRDVGTLEKILNPIDTIYNKLTGKQPPAERVINYDQLQKDAERARNGAVPGKIISADGREITKSSINGAISAAQKAEAALASALQTSRTKPVSAGTMARLQRDVEATSSRAVDLLKAVGADPSLMPVNASTRNPDGITDADRVQWGIAGVRFSRPRQGY